MPKRTDADGGGDPAAQAADILAHYRERQTAALDAADADAAISKAAPALAADLDALAELRRRHGAQLNGQGDAAATAGTIAQAIKNAAPSVQAARGRTLLEMLSPDDLPGLLEDDDARDRIAALYNRDRGAWDAAVIRLRDYEGWRADDLDRVERAARDRAKRIKPFLDPPSPHPKAGLGADGLTQDDMGNARRIVRAHGNVLKFVPGPCWHSWDGRRWEPDETGEVMRAAKTVADDLLDEAKKLPTGGDEWKAAIRFATASGSRRRLEAAVKLAETELPIIALADQLDAGPWLLNAQNGTVDLRTGELRPHDRADLLTKLAGTAYDPDTAAPRFERFLTEIFDGDQDLAAYVQRAAGYSLTGDTSEQCLFLLHGGGANGKTTFVEALATAFGDYTAGIAVSSLTTDHRRSVRSDLARLRGARLVSGTEAEQTSAWAESLVKQVTGGDRIVVAELYKAEFEYRPAFKLWLGVNHLPEVRGGGQAIWRRMRVIPFPVRIDRPERHLGRALQDELPGILAWAVRGCLDWQQRGLDEPQAVLDATAAYHTAQPPEATVAEFIAELCHTGDPHAWTPTDVLLRAYAAWAASRGQRAIGPEELTTRLMDRGHQRERKRIGGGVRATGLHGLALRAEEEL